MIRMGTGWSPMTNLFRNMTNFKRQISIHTRQRKQKSFPGLKTRFLQEQRTIGFKIKNVCICLSLSRRPMHRRRHLKIREWFSDMLNFQQKRNFNFYSCMAWTEKRIKNPDSFSWNLNYSFFFLNFRAFDTCTLLNTFGDIWKL